MGSSHSTPETAQLVRSLLSDEVIPAESLTPLLHMVSNDEECSLVFPFEQLRLLRHFHTHNLAALLHRCIAAVASVAVRRTEINTSSDAPGVLLPAEAVTEFNSALCILRRILPVALEDGATPCGTADGPTMSDTSISAPHGQEGGGAPPPASSPARTAYTSHFQQLFFVEGRTCNASNSKEVLPLLPGQAVRLFPSRQQTTSLPLGALLVRSLVECCFIRGLTLPDALLLPAEAKASITHAEVDMELMWCPGIGSEDPLQALSVKTAAPIFAWATSRISRTRRAIIDTLFVALSSPIYHAAGFRDAIFLEPLLSTVTVPLMPTLSLSMLNTVLRYVPYGILPYTSHLGREEKELGSSCVRLLDVTLCYMGIPLDPQDTPEPQHCGSADATAPVESSPIQFNGSQSLEPKSPSTLDGPLSNTPKDREISLTSSELRVQAPDHIPEVHPVEGTRCTSPPHAQADEGEGSTVRLDPPYRGPPRFVHCVRKALRDVTLTESKGLMQRMSVLLGLNVYASQTYLPVSQIHFDSLDYLMILFWKILDLSPSFLALFGTSAHALDYVIPILDYALAVCRSPLHTYQFQLMLFVLTRLSEMRGFVMQCNQVCTAKLPSHFPPLASPHTYNDLIVLALCRVMEMRDLQALAPLLPSCTVVLANMAPYITSLGAEPSTKLVSAFAHAAYHCLQSDIPSDAGAATRAAEHAPTPEMACSMAQQTQMLNLCEAMASLLQYQFVGACYVLASLVDHRALILELREVYEVQRTKMLTIPLLLPFLIATLDAAVAVALPVVESTEALRRTNSRNEDAGTDSAKYNSAAPQGGTMILAPPAGVGASGAERVVSNELASRLRSLMLVGALPTPHRIVIRRFQSTSSVEEWTSTTFWICAYIHSPRWLLGDRDSVKLVRFL